MENKSTQVVQFQGPDGKIQEKSAFEVEIIDDSDKWSSATLSDGAKLRYKNPIVKVFRVVDEYDKEGNPVYIINHAGIMAVSVPDSLKKKGV